MDNLEDAIRDLKYLAQEEYRAEQELDNFRAAALSPLLADELRQEIQERTTKKGRQFGERLQFLLDFYDKYPVHHMRHWGLLEEFWTEGSFDDSVFIMTKFPVPGQPNAADLEKVLQSLAQATRDCGLTPRLASDHSYHPLLWDNVELYLLGCSRGIALVEDRYEAELNPNVMMEWGWMRAMGRPVHFLLEVKFEHLRADLSGLLSETFSWEQASIEVPVAVKRLLRSR